MTNLMAFFNAFSERMRRLAKLAGDDPSKVALLLRNDEQGREIIGWLYDAGHMFEAIRKQSTHLKNVPAWFLEEYSNFASVWWKAIDDEFGKLSWDALMAELDGDKEEVAPDILIKAIMNRSRPAGIADVGARTDYVPGFGLGAKSVDHAMAFLWDSLQLGDEKAWDSDFSEIREGYEAWEFFREEVKVDFDGIERRWLSLPRMMVPTSLRRDNGAREYQAMIELLDDATKAYIYGAPAAAIAMCRALSEMLLARYYLPVEESLDDRDRSKGLSKLIPLAEKRLEWLKGLQLGSLTARGHQVMHRMHERPLELEMELVAEQYLATMKTLVERAVHQKIEK